MQQEMNHLFIKFSISGIIINSFQNIIVNILFNFYVCGVFESIVSTTVCYPIL